MEIEDEVILGGEPDKLGELNKRLNELKSGLSEENRKYRDAVMRNLLVKHGVAEDKLSYIGRLIDSESIETEGFEEKAGELIRQVVADLPSLLKAVGEIGVNPAGIISKENPAEDLRTIVSRKLRKNKK